MRKTRKRQAVKHEERQMNQRDGNNKQGDPENLDGDGSHLSSAVVMTLLYKTVACGERGALKHTGLGTLTQRTYPLSQARTLLVIGLVWRESLNERLPKYQQQQFPAALACEARLIRAILGAAWT